ncbi:MAG: zinc ribbon domain-containing protein [Bacteroidota bacterium]
MKTCPNCKSEIEDGSDLCWNCQYSFSEERIVPKTEFSEVCSFCNVEVDGSFKFCPNCHHKLGPGNNSAGSFDYPGTLNIDCLRCKAPMFFKGNSKFHEGTRTGALGNAFELLINRESFDIYFCPRCGKVEFFLPLADNPD